jgi:hypothetical protein
MLYLVLSQALLIKAQVPFLSSSTRGHYIRLEYRDKLTVAHLVKRLFKF